MGVQQSNSRFSTGCPDARAQDGDIGTQEESATRCPAVRSINKVNPPEMGAASSSRPPIISTREMIPPEDTNHFNDNASSHATFKVNTPPSPNQDPQGQGVNGQVTLDLIHNTVNGSKRPHISRKTKKSNITIASLNIHGKTTDSGDSKIQRLSTIMKQRKYAIVAIQETRINTEIATQLQKLHPSIVILNNGQFSSKQGVAFIINKKLFAGKNNTWTHYPLIDNRASLLRINWRGEHHDIINIYSPNADTDKLAFIENLTNAITSITDLQNPILLGDWNCVEDSLDRQPPREDDHNVLIALDNLKHKLKLVDGWRLQHPTDLKYSLTHVSNNTLARIDRIYVTKTQELFTNEWKIDSSASLSDHDFVSVKLLKQHEPEQGPGLARFPIDVLDYPPFALPCLKALVTAQQKIKDHTLPNKQDTWQELQKEILALGLKYQKQRKTQQSAPIRELERDISRILNQIKRHNQVPKNLQLLKKKKAELHNLLASRAKACEIRAKARYDMEGDCCSATFLRSQKPHIEHEPIIALLDVNQNIETDSKKMADIAANYHTKQQAAPELTDDRKRAIEKLLTTQLMTLDPTQQQEMAQPISTEEIRTELMNTKNGKSPGPSGIPYEFWKHWEKLRPKGKREKPSKNASEWKTLLHELDIIDTMSHVFKDIWENGLHNNTFNKGVMTLLYKKKDRQNIANYRPITLLNSDYKLYTKAISARLGKIAQTLIHPDQQGFIPKRGLQDATRLSRMMVDYCSILNKNGCIVSLDQEKAYDRIAHDYLWLVLYHMRFPKSFIALVQQLYSNAETTVIINGMTSNINILVNRGLRQGDGMSCLLFDIAIEPLASAIRASKISGFQIKEELDNVLASLFADDTMAYLAEHDDPIYLWDTIDLYCLASTARFNIEKTKYLPVGRPAFRESVILSGKMNNSHSFTIPKDQIVKEQEPLRTLGAYIGNNINIDHVWSGIIERQQTILNHWESAHPSYRGKELVLKLLMQSLAPFLMTVNNIPDTVLKRIHNLTHTYLWEGRRNGYVSWKEAITPKSQGGLDMPDIKLRNEAIQIMWVKRWLAPPETKPMWANVMDEIIKANIPAKPIVEDSAVADWVLQTWHEKELGDSLIPDHAKLIIRTARKYNLGFNAPKVDINTKKDMIIWNHPGVISNYMWNKKSTKCLRNIHHITTVRNLVDFNENPIHSPGCRTLPKCTQMAHDLVRAITEKLSPLWHTPHRDGLDHTPRRIKLNKEQDITKKAVTFNPDITAKMHPRNHIRIFQNKDTYKQRNCIVDTNLFTTPAYRAADENKDNRPLTLYTDGSAINGEAGIGVRESHNSEFNRSLKAPAGPQTNNRAELCAIIEAVRINQNRPLTILTDSKNTVLTITTRVDEIEDKDFYNTANAAEWKILLALLRQRQNTTSFQWVEGHNGIEGNEQADQLANEGRENGPVMILPDIPIKWHYDGARLQALTQKDVYRMLVKTTSKSVTERPKVKENIKNIKDRLMAVSGILPTDKSIWKNIHHSPSKKRKGDFLWKLITGTLRTGEYFRQMNDSEHRELCKHCNLLESATHLLLDCTRAKSLWNSIADTWNNDYNDDPWLMPDLPLIMGLGSLRSVNTISKPLIYLYKQYVMAAVWVIWKSRNAMIFENQINTKDRLLALWKHEVFTSAEIDFDSVNLRPYTKQKLCLGDTLDKWEKSTIFDTTPFRIKYESMKDY
jgi:ribonuclease HI/exonuclease III